MAYRKVIGIHSCKEALKCRNPKELKNFFIIENAIHKPSFKELLKLAKEKNLKPELVSPKKLNKLLDYSGDSHQGVLLEVHHSFKEDLCLKKIIDQKDATILVLDRIQDPRNLGAIIRTAWLMSVSCLFLSDRNSVGLTPSVIKSASGAVEHLPIFIKNNLCQVLKQLKESRFLVYALCMSAQKSLWGQNLSGKKAFVLGGEQKGIRASLIKSCDERLSIPQKEKDASYNVSVASAIVLSEDLKQKNLQT